MNPITVADDRARWTVRDLTDGERAVLLAVRRWSRSGSLSGMGGVREALARVGAPGEALLPLFALMGVLDSDRSRRIAVRRPACTGMEMDEARLLDALAAAQAGEEEAALRVLGRWLPTIAACTAVDALRDLGGLLAEAGVLFPGGRSGPGFGLAGAVSAART